MNDLKIPQPSLRDRESTLTKLRRLADLVLERGDATPELVAKVATSLSREAEAERRRRRHVNRLRRARRKVFGNAPGVRRPPAVNLRDLIQSA